MSSPSTAAASPPVAAADGSGGTASSNYTLLYIIVAVLVGVILYVVIRYGRSVLAEWRQLQAGHNGAGRPRSARAGLSPDEIAALPTFTFRVRAASASPLAAAAAAGKGKGKGASTVVVECVVCLQDLEDGDVVRVLPACRHFFHAGCIDAWLRAHSSCPVCRADLVDPDDDFDGARLVNGEVAVSPPLPQLRRCGVSPERPSSASRVLADILARSPLRSPSPTPRGYARVDGEHWATAKTPSPGLSEIVVVRSKTPSPMRLGGKPAHLSSPSPSPRRIGVLESAEVITSPSAAPVVLEAVIVRSMTMPSPTRLNRQLSARSNVAVVESMEGSTALASPSPMPIGEDGGGSLSKSSSPVHIQ
ncbi:hypothetical protein PR202_gb27598 [Eleusine coracana subsp. coracana]|uniref:RING-type E3 ubiquitin transferase n=1 Tax=Eleusine coracana subsp. coracana TaxID=191504 RepID=A0AAV5FS96_ELECO|nr:hypothetical protein PR202_gb27598 [Eleusine coracana subsp. coracana]